MRAMRRARVGQEAAPTVKPLQASRPVPAEVQAQRAQAAALAPHPYLAEVATPAAVRAAQVVEGRSAVEVEQVATEAEVVQAASPSVSE